MADFVQNAAVKSAKRVLASPIENLTTFSAIVDQIIADNPWGCVDYAVSGATVEGCLKGTEKYSGKVVYEDGLAKTVGQISVSTKTPAGFNTELSTIIGTAALGTAMGGSPSHDSSDDTWSVAIKCNHTNGEKYTVTVKRDAISISSYETDAIVTGIETWADLNAALA